MGQSQSDSVEESFGQRFDRDDWIKIDDHGRYEIWKSEKYSLIAESYKQKNAPSQKDIEHYRFRRLQHKYLVSVLAVDILQQKKLCCKGEAYVLTEYIPVTLSELHSLSRPQGMMLLRAIFSALNTMSAYYSPFIPSEDLIGFNIQGKPKVWLNEDHSKNEPIRIIKAEIWEKHQGDISENIRTVVEMVQEKMFDRQFEREFRQTFYHSNLDYEQAIQYVEEYCSKENIRIPESVNIMRFLTNAKVLKMYFLVYYVFRVNEYHHQLNQHQRQLQSQTVGGSSKVYNTNQTLDTIDNKDHRDRETFPSIVVVGNNSGDGRGKIIEESNINSISRIGSSSVHFVNNRHVHEIDSSRAQPNSRVNSPSPFSNSQSLNLSTVQSKSLTKTIRPVKHQLLISSNVKEFNHPYGQLKSQSIQQHYHPPFKQSQVIFSNNISQNNNNDNKNEVETINNHSYQAQSQTLNIKQQTPMTSATISDHTKIMATTSVIGMNRTQTVPIFSYSNKKIAIVNNIDDINIDRKVVNDLKQNNEINGNENDKNNYINNDHNYYNNNNDNELLERSKKSQRSLHQRIYSNYNIDGDVLDVIGGVGGGENNQDQNINNNNNNETELLHQYISKDSTHQRQLQQHNNNNGEDIGSQPDWGIEENNNNNYYHGDRVVEGEIKMDKIAQEHFNEPITTTTDVAVTTVTAHFKKHDDYANRKTYQTDKQQYQQCDQEGDLETNDANAGGYQQYKAKMKHMFDQQRQSQLRSNNHTSKAAQIQAETEARVQHSQSPSSSNRQQLPDNRSHYYSYPSDSLALNENNSHSHETGNFGGPSLTHTNNNNDSPTFFTHKQGAETRVHQKSGHHNKNRHQHHSSSVQSYFRQQSNQHFELQQEPPQPNSYRENRGKPGGFGREEQDSSRQSQGQHQSSSPSHDTNTPSITQHKMIKEIEASLKEKKRIGDYHQLPLQSQPERQLHQQPSLQSCCDKGSSGTLIVHESKDNIYANMSSPLSEITNEGWPYKIEVENIIPEHPNNQSSSYVVQKDNKISRNSKISTSNQHNFINNPYPYVSNSSRRIVNFSQDSLDSTPPATTLIVNNSNHFMRIRNIQSNELLQTRPQYISVDTVYSPAQKRKSQVEDLVKLQRNQDIQLYIRNKYANIIDPFKKGNVSEKPKTQWYQYEREWKNSDQLQNKRTNKDDRTMTFAKPADGAKAGLYIDVDSQSSSQLPDELNKQHVFQNVESHYERFFVNGTPNTKVQQTGAFSASGNFDQVLRSKQPGEQNHLRNLSDDDQNSDSQSEEPDFLDVKNLEKSLDQRYSKTDLGQNNQIMKKQSSAIQNSEDFNVASLEKKLQKFQQSRQSNFNNQAQRKSSEKDGQLNFQQADNIIELMDKKIQESQYRKSQNLRQSQNKQIQQAQVEIAQKEQPIKEQLIDIQLQESLNPNQLRIPFLSGDHSGVFNNDSNPNSKRNMPRDTNKFGFDSDDFGQRNHISSPHSSTEIVVTKQQAEKKLNRQPSSRRSKNDNLKNQLTNVMENNAALADDYLSNEYSSKQSFYPKSDAYIRPSQYSQKSIDYSRRKNQRRSSRNIDIQGKQLIQQISSKYEKHLQRKSNGSNNENSLSSYDSQAEFGSKGKIDYRISSEYAVQSARQGKQNSNSHLKPIDECYNRNNGNIDNQIRDSNRKLGSMNSVSNRIGTTGRSRGKQEKYLYGSIQNTISNNKEINNKSNNSKASNSGRISYDELKDLLWN